MTRNAMGVHMVRIIGLARAKGNIGMMNLVYNMKRIIQLIRRDALAVKLAHGYVRIGAFAVA
jgi:hypothetical protein